MFTQISLTLDAIDLQPFLHALGQARQGLRDATDRDSVVNAAQRGLARSDSAQTPEFVRQRLELIPSVGAFVRDTRWDASLAAVEDLAGALAYFSEPCDLIPDASPQFGLLDDALVLELALRRHLAEWREWRRFDALRQARTDLADELDRQAWLALRERQRRQLLQRSPWNRFARPLSHSAGDPGFQVH